ncbi:uncharacterized protein LOC125660456 isoform X2 [Ostrea edulis]|uniref:uncharacterized protein LOC125660456 isoform X2 n=1 Tax=Ostrea edulis TaxID=37623 RepID=UPI0024AECE5C|nr:uncharacterized protein LOC125660456 isoform X2 [Ostrea edulis]
MINPTLTTVAVLLVIYSTAADVTALPDVNSASPGADSASTSISTTSSSVSTTSTSISTTSAESVNECKDAEDFDCELYNPKVICNTTGIYYPWSRVRCPLYCGFCHRPTLTILCKDEIPNCADYQGDMCTNPFYRLFREKNCRKSCNICKGFDSIPNLDSLYG